MYEVLRRKVIVEEKSYVSDHIAQNMKSDHRMQCHNQGTFYFGGGLASGYEMQLAHCSTRLMGDVITLFYILHHNKDYSVEPFVLDMFFNFYF